MSEGSVAISRRNRPGSKAKVKVVYHISRGPLVSNTL